MAPAGKFGLIRALELGAKYIYRSLNDSEEAEEMQDEEEYEDEEEAKEEEEEEEKH